MRSGPIKTWAVHDKLIETHCHTHELISESWVKPLFNIRSPGLLTIRASDAPHNLSSAGTDQLRLYMCGKSGRRGVCIIRRVVGGAITRQNTGLRKSQKFMNQNM